MFRGTCRAVTESDGQDINDVAFEERKFEADVNVIDTVDKIRSVLSNRDQLRVCKVRRFQHVADFPADSTMSCAVQTNNLRNNLISKRHTHV